MSVSRPARCVLSAPSPSLRLCCRKFQTTPKLSGRRRPAPPNVKAVDMGLITTRKATREVYKLYSEEEENARDVFRKYNDNEKAALAQRYTPSQLEAIEAGEEAISPADLNYDAVVRTDIGALKYLDDFSQYRTMLDKKPEEDTPVDPNARLMTEEEFADGYVDWQMKIEKLQDPNLKKTDPDYATKKRPNRSDIEFRAPFEVPISVGTDGRHQTPVLSTFQPSRRGLPSKEDEAIQKIDLAAEVDDRDPDGTYTKLMKKTGMTLDEILNIKVKILVKHNVSNQTRLGKIMSMYCLAIAGNEKGRLGLGQAKGQEMENTQNLAKIAAIYNMRPIARYEERTIFGEVDAKVGAVEVKLMTRPPGFGLRCQHNIFEMARAAGIQDLAARVPRSRNKMNTVKAAFQALTSQRLPDDIARGRGKKMVDVRKVYYGGRV
ncbi:ribosomal protein S5, C-terminal domain-containing protein [Calycina marina]|uniref:Ribosomal protein S5, C-terminal domain-containing protein n=1 Tax=Calycina marina TaxID=1763456 RepID=A0A9P8CCY8_9HELO|nr:ribosomal protein S5, C-terminal domain-containing protein [Calycina marina]